MSRLTYNTPEAEKTFAEHDVAGRLNDTFDNYDYKYKGPSFKRSLEHARDIEDFAGPQGYKVLPDNTTDFEESVSGSYPKKRIR